jgi:phage shock protein PspC (stress-responsive transcriptional regulator)
MGLILFMAAIALMAMIGTGIAAYINREAMFPKYYSKRTA